MKHLLAVMGVLAVTAVTALRNGCTQEVHDQPIAFNHQLHHEEGLGCLDCHPRAEDSPYAGLPPIRGCMLCHSEPQGEHPDEPLIREYAESDGAIPWIQVNRMEGHVYFSHAAHVRFARMDCAACHGDMTVETEPVTVSQIDALSMTRCMDCHREEGVTNDCLACHK